jgi:hypothetical protein
MPVKSLILFKRNKTVFRCFLQGCVKLNIETFRGLNKAVFSNS